MTLPIHSIATFLLSAALILLCQIPVAGQSTDSLPLFSTQTASIRSIGKAPLDSLLLMEACDAFADQLVEEEPEPAIACRPVVVPLRDNKATQVLIARYTGSEQRYITSMLQRSQQYFPIYEHYLQKYGLPNELKYISVIESNLNPTAKSPCKATGLWQFMSTTGKVYKLDQNAYLDERMDPYKATEAACRYLKDLHRLFGDWELALAAYNCGPTNVRRAIRRSGNLTGFWEIYPFLPPETRGYVPKFAVIHSLMASAQSDTLTLAPLLSDTICINQAIDLTHLASELTVPLLELRMLNPHLKKNMAPSSVEGYTLRIPSAKKPYFVAHRSAILASMAITLPKKAASNSAVSGKRKITHTVSNGQNISRIASKYQVSVVEIKRWNHLHSDRLKIGQRLVIWIKAKPVRKKSR